MTIYSHVTHIGVLEKLKSVRICQFNTVKYTIQTAYLSALRVSHCYISCVHLTRRQFQRNREGLTQVITIHYLYISRCQEKKITYGGSK